MIFSAVVDGLSIVKEKFDEFIVLIVEDGEKSVLGLEFGLAVKYFEEFRFHLFGNSDFEVVVELILEPMSIN